jgi:hypothetical protein
MLLDFYQRNKTKIIIGSLLSLIVIVGLILFLTRPGKVTVTSESGAELSVATEKSGMFKKIGVGTATYSTRKVPSEVYVMATKDGKKTISGLVAERGKTKSVNLALTAQVSVKPIMNGSVSSAFFDGTVGQGIVAGDYSLVNFKTDRVDEPLRPEFIGIPYLKKAIWYDANNFVYNSFRQGVGRFINGKHVGKEGFANSISGKDLDSLEPEETDDIVDIKDISRSGDKPLVLLSSSNIFISNDRGGSLRSIAGFEPTSSSTVGLFTTSDYIFRFAGDDPSAHASESEAPSNNKNDHASTLYQYDYSGKELAKLSIHSESVRAVASRGKKSFILTPEKLILSEAGGTSDLALYFTYARDITTYKNRVVLLGDGGLWQIGDDGVSLQLLYDFKESGVGLAQSFSISAGSLIFGTEQRPGDTKNTSKMFVTQF